MGQEKNSFKLKSYFPKAPLAWLGVTALLYLSLSLLVALYSFSETKKQIREETDKRLLMGAKSLSYILPPHIIDRGTLDQNLDRKLFVHLSQKLSEVNEALGFSNIYSIVFKDGKYYFTSNSLSKKEWAEIEKHHYFDVYDDAPSSVLNHTLETMEIQYHEYKDSWGEFRSVFVPKQAPNGVKYILAADIDIAQIERTLYLRLGSQFVFIFLLFTSFVPLLFYVRMLYNAHRKKMEDINHELEQKVQERTNALLHANRLVEVGTLAAGAAHEIKNPLSIIQIYTETLLEREGEEKLPEDVEQMLKKMAHSTMRIKDLADGLRSFAKPADAKDFGVISLHKIIEHTLLIYEPIYKKKIRVKMIPDLAAKNDRIIGLSTHFEQILSNIFSNARDAIEETGRHEGRIWIETKLIGAQEDFLELSIRDDGKGMKPETLQKLFTPFLTTKAADKGTGLGLSIIQSLILSMKGRIDVDSKLGEGTVFKMTFPLALKD